MRAVPRLCEFTLAFALQLKKKNRKTSVRVRKTSVRLIKTSVSVQYRCMKLGFSSQIFEKYSKVKFHQNLSSENRVIPYGQKDRNDEVSLRFSQFCERA
jgi:hypothetical protein